MERFIMDPGIKRINIIGSSGSGKTTLGREIARILEIPFVETDALFWEHGWQAPPDDRFLAKLETALQGDEWVLDGNYTRSIPIKWARVQAVVWLDLPFHTVFFRSLTRAVKRIRSGKEIWPDSGCHETFGQTFLSRKSILLWMITQFRKLRRRAEAFTRNPELSHIRFIRLRSPREIETFLTQLQHPNSAGDPARPAVTPEVG